MTIRIDTARPPAAGHHGTMQATVLPHPQGATPADVAGASPPKPTTTPPDVHPPLNAAAAATLARQVSEHLARQGRDAMRTQTGISPDVVLRLLQD